MSKCSQTLRHTLILLAMSMGLSACTPAAPPSRAGAEPVGAEPLATELSVSDAALSVNAVGPVTLEVRNGIYVRGSVPFRFTNLDELVVAQPGCNGPHPPRLEVQELAGTGGTWRKLYSPELDLCDGPTVQIAPGEVYMDTLRVGACIPGHNCSPAFLVEGPATEAITVRLVWTVYPTAEPPYRSSKVPRPGKRVESAPFPLRVVWR